MKRASITIETRFGVYDANNIVIGHAAAPPGESGLVSTISFLSSGFPQTLYAREVKEIRFSPAAASWCPFCDEPLKVLGAGEEA